MYVIHELFIINILYCGIEFVQKDFIQDTVPKYMFIKRFIQEFFLFFFPCPPSPVLFLGSSLYSCPFQGAPVVVRTGVPRHHTCNVESWPGLGFTSVSLKYSDLTVSNRYMVKSPTFHGRPRDTFTHFIESIRLPTGGFFSTSIPGNVRLRTIRLSSSCVLVSFSILP